MKTRQFWYPLPERLIAQHPSERRGDDRMMVLHRDTGLLEHRRVVDFVDYITPDDLMVVNDTKVFPARLLGTWSDSPGSVEVLMVAPSTDADSLDGSVGTAKEVLSWRVMVGSGRPSREGQIAVFGPNGELKVQLVEKVGGGMWKCNFISNRPLGELLDEFGHTPVPPYVRRQGTREEEMADRERYQTIYAKHVGSMAAPTAGLHFTPEIFAALEAKGVRRVSVTLHVGPGTFRPVKAENVEDHEMDFEAFTVPPETAEAINACKARGGRVFCVGSTSVRTLETVASRQRKPEDPLVVGGSGASNIFIYPPYQFKVCDCMLTNFHLPQSTLLMMTSALAGRERMLCAYAMAVRASYRFFSYGDCMLIV
ncbi:MAG: tRNA preQ1(34) S-adenosylmethionine ribosyltransferase-isomerase QueA [Kiritimatiellia bacterium]